ncbi:unnamed protein product [Arctogadus glacialis]
MKLAIATGNSPHSVNQLREQIALQLSKIPETPADPDVNITWSTLRTAIHRAAVESVGYTRRRLVRQQCTSATFHLLHSSPWLLITTPGAPPATRELLTFRSKPQRGGYSDVHRGISVL